MRTRFHGPVPEVGARVRHYHPWIDDYATGTVTRVEMIEPRSIQFPSGQWHARSRVYLTDCMHWDSEHRWGPAPDTYFDNLSETWEYDVDAQTGLETALPAPDAEA